MESWCHAPGTDVVNNWYEDTCVGSVLKMSLTERTDPMTSPRSFKEWMAAVNEARVRKVGVCSSDLPNFTYRDLYDQGCTPEEAADAAIENAMS